MAKEAEAPLSVTKLQEGVYEVPSATSSTIYVVRYGREGPYWSCTCTRWAITRNRAGGMGNKGECKHVRAVEAAEAHESAARNLASVDEAKQADLVERFRQLERDLR